MGYLPHFSDKNKRKENTGTEQKAECPKSTNGKHEEDAPVKYPMEEPQIFCKYCGRFLRAIPEGKSY